MPTYDFECEKCGHKQQKLVSVRYPKRSKCPKCQEDTLIRLVGSGSGVIFKGKGFYETDYRKKES